MILSEEEGQGIGAGVGMKEAQHLQGTARNSLVRVQGCRVKWGPKVRGDVCWNYIKALLHMPNYRIWILSSNQKKYLGAQVMPFHPHNIISRYIWHPKGHIKTKGKSFVACVSPAIFHLSTYLLSSKKELHLQVHVKHFGGHKKYFLNVLTESSV